MWKISEGLILQQILFLNPLYSIQKIFSICLWTLASDIFAIQSIHLTDVVINTKFFHEGWLKLIEIADGDWWELDLLEWSGCGGNGRFDGGIQELFGVVDDEADGDDVDGQDHQNPKPSLPRFLNN